MKVLITGIDGYIGTILAEYLIQRGHEVVGLDTGFYKEGWLYEGVELAKEIINKDIRDVSIKDLTGFDTVIHLAELSNDPLGQNNPELTYEINHKGTVHLADTAKKAGVERFIYSSSCSVYGASDNISTEASPVNPLTAYAKCKILNEKVLTEMADDNFTTVILRNSTVYGLSPRMRFDLVVNNLTGVAWTTKEIKLDSSGTAWRPFVHVLDVAKAFACALEAKKEIVHKQIYNVGSDTSNYQIKSIGEIIKKLMPKCTITFNNQNVDKRNYRVNFDKISKALPGFSATHTVEEEVGNLLSKFKEIEMDRKVFESRLYTRLKQIAYLREQNILDDKFYWI